MSTRLAAMMVILSACGSPRPPAPAAAPASDAATPELAPPAQAAPAPALDDVVSAVVDEVATLDETVEGADTGGEDVDEGGPVVPDIRELFVVVRDRTVIRYGMKGGEPTAGVAVELGEPPSFIGWRGDELVVMETDERATVRVIAGGAGREIPQPPRSAWKAPRGFRPEYPDTLEQVADEHTLEIVGAEIWKGYCIDGDWREGPVCFTWAWLRLDPPGPRQPTTKSPTAAPTPPTPGATRAPDAAPVGYALTVDKVMGDEGEGGSFVVCTHGSQRSRFPDSKDHHADYGEYIDAANQPVWLPGAPRLYLVTGYGASGPDGYYGRPLSYLFEPCQATPRFQSSVDIAYGDGGWFAARPNGASEWTLLHEGREIATMDGERLVFVPGPAS